MAFAIHQLAFHFSVTLGLRKEYREAPLDCFPMRPDGPFPASSPVSELLDGAGGERHPTHRHYLRTVAFAGTQPPTQGACRAGARSRALVT